jgi:hypothetical protein
MFNFSAVMSIPAKLALHQFNLKVGPMHHREDDGKGQRMLSVNVKSLRCRNRGGGDAPPCGRPLR